MLELASHGYLVIASGRIYSGPGAHPAPIPPKPFPRTPTSGLTDAIDWALAENQRQGSPYFGRIDPQAIAVAGFSCGGLQAAQVASDPRVATLIMQNTGTYDGERATMPGLKVPKTLVKTYHTPVLYILGGPTDVAYENGMAPNSILATSRAMPDVSRPLCPYPQVARFDGGDPNDAESFSCQ